MDPQSAVLRRGLLRESIDPRLELLSRRTVGNAKQQRCLLHHLILRELLSFHGKIVGQDDEEGLLNP